MFLCLLHIFSVHWPETITLRAARKQPQFQRLECTCYQNSEAHERKMSHNVFKNLEINSKGKPTSLKREGFMYVFRKKANDKYEYYSFRYS